MPCKVPDKVKEGFMLLVLGCAVLLLVVVPWMLFGLGRMIDTATSGRARAAAAGVPVAAGADAARGTEAAWFRRPMRPAFNSSRRRPARHAARL